MQISSRKKRTGSRPKSSCCAELTSCLDAKLFRALGDPTRVHILVCLSKCRDPQSVGDIGACCDVDLSVVSRHLAILRDAGILNVRKKGRSVFYEIRYSGLADTLRQVADALEACCPD